MTRAAKQRELTHERQERWDVGTLSQGWRPTVTMEENSFTGWETRLKTSEVLSNSKSMNSSFLLSKQNTSKCCACSKPTLPTKANSDVNGPKILHNLTSNVKPFSCFRILAFVRNFSFQGQSPLHSILVTQGRGGCLGFFRKSHVCLKQSPKF